MNHVLHQKYILVPRICNFGKKEDVCVKFNGLYDDVLSTFDVKLLTYDIDVLNKKTEEKGLIKLGMLLNKKYSECKKAYK